MATEPPNADLTAEQARALLRYEPETGLFFWLVRPIELFPDQRAANSWNAQFAGKPALDTFKAGYRHGRIFARYYKAHRVAWLMQTGNWPEDQVDHANGVRYDNRWANLRAADSSRNNRNRGRDRRNTSGVCGVDWAKRDRKWRARITVDGKDKYLGLFDSLEAAIAARVSANAEYGFSDRHGAD